jgi:hypothetical protein
MIALLKSDLDMFPKISPKSFQLRFSTGYVEVITGRFEPHLNHELLKSLIINKYTILHREIKSAYKQYPSIIKLIYLLDNQPKTKKSTDG